MSAALIIAAVTAFTVLALALVINYASHKTYAFKVLIYIDQFLAALIFNDADVTISSMVGLALKEAKPPLWARALGWGLNHLQANHTTLAIENDVARAKAALKLLGG